jgi:hypothetical protein
MAVSIPRIRRLSRLWKVCPIILDRADLNDHASPSHAAPGIAKHRSASPRRAKLSRAVLRKESERHALPGLALER